MTEPIRIQHDFNDRNEDGSYSVWIPPATQIILFDGETEEHCIAYGDFIDVIRLPQRTT